MNPPTQPSATHGVTPRTQALWMKHHAFCNEDEATEALCDFRDLGNALETELAAAKAECERLKQNQMGFAEQLFVENLTADLAEVRADFASMTMQAATAADRNVGLRLDADRLRSEVEKATAKIANQAERIRYLEGATNHATGTPLSLATARAERAELALANAQCPNVVCSKEGTQYCALAESSVAKLEAQLAAARKDSERFNLLATLLEDVYIGDIDPTKHRTEDNEWPDAWRDAIDAAMTNSKNT